MDHKSFIEKVRLRAGLESEDEAVKITGAALETLGERISKTERHELAAQLTEELKILLFKRERTERFPLEEFYNRFGGRVRLTHHRAVEQSRAVMLVLREAISPGELEDILSEFPAEYKELFGKEPESPASPTFHPLGKFSGEHIRSSGKESE